MRGLWYSKPPETVDIDGRRIPVNSDFRIWITISEIMSDRSIEDNDKFARALVLCYGKGNIPENLPEAIKQMVEFFRAESFENTGHRPTGKGGQIYSYRYDAEYIYSAFMEQYGIDLTEAELHWWKFKAMFKALSDNTKFSKIIGYRGMNTAEIKDKKLKSRYAELKLLYALPDMRTDEEKEADWGAAF